MKAVCPKHHVAYDTTTGCADCLARERDAYHARGVPDDDSPLYTTAVNPWLDASRDILADLAEAALRVPDFGRMTMEQVAVVDGAVTFRVSVPWKLRV